eukprot:CAMPEP_0180564832 /NCGR_PEP_ID=MMETSP1037_2-20121125/5220_1 /TAXON_ID=632150 /ORGANISM="Azadinium spinosum, Strain 3D9" /LENGTH=65 /DNA_ID=CAMNT_0022581757 /DNA_START=599 /DNA_END=796 /DNA_ORIENTATION=-
MAVCDATAASLAALLPTCPPTPGTIDGALVRIASHVLAMVTLTIYPAVLRRCDSDACTVLDASTT